MVLKLKSVCVCNNITPKINRTNISGVQLIGSTNTRSTNRIQCSLLLEFSRTKAFKTNVKRVYINISQHRNKYTFLRSDLKCY